eukprot:scaffold1074_cov409-Prasinococcus_capsulatus_cf.AAC.22
MRIGLLEQSTWSLAGSKESDYQGPIRSERIAPAGHKLHLALDLGGFELETREDECRLKCPITRAKVHSSPILIIAIGSSFQQSTPPNRCANHPPVG